MAVKTYTENGKEYQFCGYKLRYAIEDRRSTQSVPGDRMTKVKIYDDMKDKLNVSVDTVKSWEKGANGPVDLDMVKRIADYFNTDYHEFIEEKMEDKNMSIEMYLKDTVDVKQRAATRDRARDIYEALVEAVDEAHNYFYFEYYSYLNSDLVNIYDTEYEEAQEACYRVKFLLLKYALDLPQELEKKIRMIFKVEAEGFVEDTNYAFMIENKENIDELKHKLDFEMLDYYYMLKEVFGEFRVQ